MADKKMRRPFDPKAAAHRIVAPKVIAHGVLTRPLPFIEVISFSPSLCITESEIDQGVEGFARGLEDATPDLRKAAAQ